MVISTIPFSTPSTPGQPAWEIARLFPNQGGWTEADYLVLNHLTNHFAELSDGMIEVLEMPTLAHQRIVARLNELLSSFVKSKKLGTVVLAPYPVRLWEGKFREPDLLFMKGEHAARLTDDYAEGADVVFEVVSKGDPARDIVVKRAEYARAGIAEYWIVDPVRHEIVVLKLNGEQYEISGTYRQGDTAASATLAGFTINVDETMKPE
jgi:Uma2 family endonuclease